MGMAGEFLVAGELLRRGVHCSVTYGSAKKADVIAFSQDTERFVSIEVKTTSEKSWILGSSIPAPSDKLWVFVLLPSDLSQSPEFFVLTSREINDFLTPLYQEYLRKYRIKNGKEFEGPGVENLSLKQAEIGRNQWQKVLDQLA